MAKDSYRGAVKPFRWTVEKLAPDDLAAHPDGESSVGLYRTDATGDRLLVMYTDDVSKAEEQRNYFANHAD